MLLALQSRFHYFESHTALVENLVAVEINRSLLIEKLNKPAYAVDGFIYTPLMFNFQLTNFTVL